MARCIQRCFAGGAKYAFDDHVADCAKNFQKATHFGLANTVISALIQPFCYVSKKLLHKKLLRIVLLILVIAVFRLSYFRRQYVVGLLKSVQ